MKMRREKKQDMPEEGWFWRMVDRSRATQRHDDLEEMVRWQGRIAEYAVMDRFEAETALAKFIKEGNREAYDLVRENKHAAIKVVKTVAYHDPFMSKSTLLNQATLSWKDANLEHIKPILDMHRRS